MSLKDLMRRDVEQVILNTDEFAFSATYTPKDGSGTTIDAAVTGDSVKPVADADGYEADTRILETVTSLDASTGISSPSLDDTLLYDSTLFRLEEIVNQNGSSITIQWHSRDITSVGRNA